MNNLLSRLQNITSKDKILKAILSPWFIAIILLVIFLSTTSYKYGWDDQHLEIPLLKSLIDNSLYTGDYYVESLKINFPSYFYPILSKFITVKQIPQTYFFLYLISRYFLFFWIYKIWLLLSKSKFKAFSCSLVFILILPVMEFLYRTFSHQEFALAFIFAGIYYFFKNRFVLAAFLLGLVANFHGLYSLFPMLFIGIYLTCEIKKYGKYTLIKTSLAFIITSLPFIVWVLRNRLFPQHLIPSTSQEQWLPLFISACPQNFFFSQFPQIPFEKLIGDINVLYYALEHYIFLAALFIVNFFFNNNFRENKKARIFCATCFGLLLGCLIFTYFYPSKFAIDLNLTRAMQFLLFLLSGFTTILLIDSIEKGNRFLCILFAILFCLLKFDISVKILSVLALIFILLSKKTLQQNNKAKYIYAGLSSFVATIIIIIIISIFKKFFTVLSAKWMYTSIGALFLANYTTFYFIKDKKYYLILRRLFIIIPFVIFFIQFTHYKHIRVNKENHGGGFWKMQRNWEHMQKIVRENTPKDSLLLVPYNLEMGGFRILSERKIIASYRDCGIIGFDYPATLSWKERIRDIKNFKFLVKESTASAIKNAILKYNVDYIVFMRYAAPKEDNSILKHIYSNEIFSLFKVIANQ